MSNVARSSSPADVSRCRCVRCVFAAVSPARPIVVSSPSGLGYVTGAMVPVEPEPETDSDNEPLSQQLPIIPRPVSPSQLSDSTDGPSGSPPTVQLPIVTSQCRLMQYYEDPCDDTSLHPKRLLMTVLVYLQDEISLPGKRLRRSRKVCNWRSVLADAACEMSIEHVQSDWAQRIRARYLYRQVAAAIGSVSRRGLVGQKLCRWAAASRDTQDRWAVLHRCYSSFPDVRQALDAALGAVCQPPPGVPAPSAVEKPAEEPARIHEAKGYGFLLTFNTSTGKGVSEVTHVINRNLTGKALCREFAQLRCYSEAFEDACRWARKLGNELGMPLICVSMEKGGRASQPWRVHIHMMIGLNPGLVDALGRATPRTVPLQRFCWNNIKPMIQTVDPFRASAKGLVSALATLSYYVVGPKIGQIFREASIWPILDHADS